MKLHHLFFILLFLFVIACSENDTSPTTTTDSSSVTHPQQTVATNTACYENQAGTDSIYLKLIDSAGNISGNLEYRLTGKDANSGTITGQMHGDTLIAEYHFQSEGQTSIREIAFLRKDSALIEGFGPVNEINGAMRFSALDSLTFNQVNSLLKVPCKN